MHGCREEARWWQRFETIRVLVADGRPLVRELLDQAISRSAEFETTMVPANKDAVVKGSGAKA